MKRKGGAGAASAVVLMMVAAVAAGPLRFDEVKAGGDTFPARFHHSASAVGTKVYVFGGYGAEGPLNDLWELNTATSKWKNLGAADAPSPRWGATAATLGGSLYVYGGYSSDQGSGTAGHSNELFKYNKDANRWELQAPSGEAPEARFGHAGVVIDDRLWVFGSHNSSKYLSKANVYDPAAGRWDHHFLEGTKYTLPSTRWGHALVAAGGAVFAFGGTEHGARSAVHGDLHRFEPGTMAWSRLEANDIVADLEYRPAPRAWACAGGSGGSLHVFGGKDWLASHDDLFVYDVAGNLWSKAEPRGFAPTARDSHTCTTVGDRMYVIGGYDGETPFSDVVALSPV